MSDAKRSPLLSWTVIAPVAGIIVLALAWGRHLGAVPLVIAAVFLIATVLAAVHHAEVVAHRVGEPYGSLVLAVSVTVIEVALILTVMSSGGHSADTLARDTVFAAVMITTNGIIGIALLVGALKFGLTHFNPEGSGAALATVATLATLGLVLPTFTTSESGPEYTTAQLVFAAMASLVLYVLFVFTQTRRHRDFFLPVTEEGHQITEDDHAAPPSGKRALLSAAMLLGSLVGVVGLAHIEDPAIKAGVEAAGFPASTVGVAIALLVLLPESIAAVRAASRRRIQTSINLGYGSAMASIGLTIPAIAIASFFMDGPLVLGLGSTQIVLLGLTVLVSVLTVVPGRATRLQGGVHLVLLAAYLFLAVNP
ncbi:calcium:proton antiporter [Glycomyces albidus]|uniref:Ionic transporter y4hA n=1 Tax=Glycomyces albidus TaxID=2656774 RepID=A0A6L5GCG4_9ACTN|nr:ionic transporter y4hA [Glycomyces albidus]MQM27328.1 ionic transporter y4hA [Glycomyces albidus]